MDNISSLPVPKEVKSKFKFSHLIYILLAFIMGQADLAPGIYSFSLVYWSLFLDNNNYLFFLVSLSTFTGLFYAGGPENVTYCAAIIGLCIYRIINKKFK